MNFQDGGTCDGVRWMWKG